MSHFIDATLPAGHPHMYLIILEYCDVLVVFDALLSLLRLSCNYCCCRWWLNLQSHSWCCIIILTCLCAAGSKILLSVTCHCTVAAALTLRAATLTSSCSPPLSLSSDRLPPTPSSPWDLRSSRFSWLTAASYTPPWKSSASMPSDLLPVTCRKKERRRCRLLQKNTKKTFLMNRFAVWSTDWCTDAAACTPQHSSAANRGM